MRYLCLLFFVFTMPLQSQDDYDYLLDEQEIVDEPMIGNFSNLEEMAQDFVLETKQLEIPGYPVAFNPSIVRWQGKNLLSFRFYRQDTRVANQIGLIFLNESFQPIGKPQLLNIVALDPYSIERRQDPRLIVINDKLFVVYNNVLKNTSPEIRRMVVTPIHFDGKTFQADRPDSLIYFDQENPMRSEKNWVPFDYDGRLLFARSLNPHWIVEPFYGLSSARTLTSTESSFSWYWGQLRGGTPAQLLGGEYLAFFHSSIDLQTVHSKGQLVQHYFMGAYTFANQPPFQLTRISPEPIIGKNFYSGKEYRTWKPLCVVFPGGYVFDENFIWIAFGRQDHEVWIVKLDQKKLFDSLVPVSQQ